MSSLVSASPAPGSEAPTRARVARPSWVVPVAVLLGLLAVVLLRARPAYDASGWLVWADQTLHGHLNLDGAPSWKPLTFLFTLPYGLTGHPLERWLWSATAGAGGLIAPFIAGRLAWRISPPGRAWMPVWFPRLAAALLAGAIVVSMTVASKTTPIDMGYLHQVLIDSSDPFVLALWLAAIDRLVARRPGWSLTLLWLAALGRPEVWVFLAGLAVWCWFRVPTLRVWAVLSLLSQPLAWFLAPDLFSNSAFSAGNLDLNQATALTHGKFLGVLDRVRGLSGTTVQIEVALAMLVGAIARDRRILGLVGLALTWSLVEVAFALHGFSAVARYLIEAGGVLAVVGGVGLAHGLAWTTRIPRRAGAVLAATLLAGLIAALVPFAHRSVNGARSVIEHQRGNASEYDALDRVVARAGGARAVIACGTPYADVGWQAPMAWEMGRNVGTIGSNAPPPDRAVVRFEHDGTGWRLALAGPAATRPGCARLAGLHS